MKKFIVETYYTCTFKTVHTLDDLNDKELSKIDGRNDGEVEVIDVKLNNRKTKKIGNKKQSSEKIKATDTSLSSSISKEIINSKNQSTINNNHPIKVKNNTYDAIMCVGTFTFGHVKPHALDEFVRISKNKSLICFTINEGIYEEYGFDKKIEELKKNKSWDVKEFFKSDYIASKDVNAWLCLAEVAK